MGKKLTAVITFIIFVLFNGTNVQAEPVEELYDLYEVPAVADVPYSIQDVLKGYHNAERLNLQYSYVSQADSDFSSQMVKIKELTKSLSVLEEQLLCSVDRSLSEILLLEEQQETTIAEIDRLQSTCVTIPIPMEKVNLETIPTKEEYANALDQLSSFKDTKDIGDITTIKSLAKVGEHNTVKTTFVSNGTITANNLFNGVVTSVGSNYVEILSFTNIIIRYFDLTNILVTVGDEVKQYEAIGTGTNKYSASMLISTTYCDITKLWEDKAD